MSPLLRLRRLLGLLRRLRWLRELRDLRLARLDLRRVDQIALLRGEERARPRDAVLDALPVGGVRREEGRRRRSLRHLGEHLEEARDRLRVPPALPEVLRAEEIGFCLGGAV